MKRKELYNSIREQIIETLTEDLYAEKPGSDPNHKLPDLISPDNTTSKDPKFLSKYAKVAEMANISSKIKAHDPEKFALAKEIYTAGRTGALLAAIEAAGEEGLTQKELGDALGLKNDSELNGIIGNLRVAGALSPKRDKIEKPVKPEKSEEPKLSPDDLPADEPEEKDDYYKPDEEDSTTEKEPTDKDIEKDAPSSYSTLSPEEEDVYNKYKQAIINKAKIINDKKASNDDKLKAKAAIDKYKSNADLKKLFNKKGIELIRFISDELKG